uniref:MFS domain-containing protein n=1 Tax=Haemonchus contortus TaxID=6289 RepID=A0A7I4Y8V1_HAECO|nr:Major facilitator superfamily MFS-1 domain containing protein [Haemonchus contortus]
MGSTTKNPMRILVPALIIDMLAFTCILPLFPSILNFYARTDHRDAVYDWCISLLKSFQSIIGVPHNERYNNVFFGGLLGSMFSALQFISSPTLGALSDIYGRRTLLLVSCIGTLISYIIWLRAETFSVFVLSRIIGGLSKANVNVATAIVSDVFKPEDNPKGMALIGISYSVGFLIGPMFGAYFSTIAPKDFPHSTPAIFSIVLTVVDFLLIAFLLPETLKFEERKKVEDISQRAIQLTSPKELFKFSAVEAPTDKKLEMQKIGIIYFIYLFLYAGMEFTLPFLTHLRFNFDNMQQGKIYLFSGLLMLPIQGYVVRKTPMVKQKRIAEIGMMCVVPAFLIIAQATNQFVFYLGLFLYAIASATVVSSLTSLVTVVNPSIDKGVLAGVFRSLGALARALGPAVAATLFWLAGPTRSYTVGGILLLIPLILLKKLENPVKESKKAL